MKKYLFLTLIIGLAIPAVSLAYIPSHWMWTDMSTVRAIEEVWGEGAFEYECYSHNQHFNPLNKCVDLTKTTKYRNDMIETARQIINNGQRHLFPQFNVWYWLVR